MPEYSEQEPLSFGPVIDRYLQVIDDLKHLETDDWTDELQFANALKIYATKLENLVQVEMQSKIILNSHNIGK